MKKPTYPKIKVYDTRNKYNWHDRDIGKVSKSAPVVTEISLAAQEADSVPLFSQVDENALALVIERVPILRFLYLEDLLDYEVNVELPKAMGVTDGL